MYVVADRTGASAQGLSVSMYKPVNHDCPVQGALCKARQGVHGRGGVWDGWGPRRGSAWSSST